MKKEGVKQTFVDNAINSVGIQQIPSNHQPCHLSVSRTQGYRDKETHVQLQNCYVQPPAAGECNVGNDSVECDRSLTQI